MATTHDLHPMVGGFNAGNGSALKVVTRLIEAAKTDTLYRDVYLAHAKEMYFPLLSHREYLRLTRDKSAIEDLLRQSHAAVEREDWSGIRDLTGRIRTLRQSMDGKKSLLELGREVYEPTVVLINPFSPGLHEIPSASGSRLQEACKRILDVLSGLGDEDSSWRGFYDIRRAHFRTISDSVESEPWGDGADPRLIRLEALQASVNGNLDLLDTLARKMLDLKVNVAPRTSSAKTDPDDKSDLGAPFPAEAIVNARRWGLVSARVSPTPVVENLLRRFAEQGRSPDAPSSREGGRRLGNVPAVGAEPPDLRPLMESLDYIVTAPLITSGGARYRPALVEEEVLVEDFPENGADPPGSELLFSLGIPRRKAVSRMEVDQALLRFGLLFLRDRLGLDPREFRLVCIPPDIYARLGVNRQWGRQAGLWTHFDGYHVLRGGVLRALVGGDARFGGVFDLCSIGSRDAREGVILRFAVVRRRRLITRYL